MIREMHSCSTLSLSVASMVAEALSIRASTSGLFRRVLLEPLMDLEWNTPTRKETMSLEV